MIVWLDSPEAQGRNFIFLDRDGVFNENRPDYVKNFQEMKFHPEALDALRVLKEKNISVIVVSNQSGVNRGLISWDDFWGMHDGMVREVEKAGGRILAALYCPHRPDENCECRKPSPAMILAACRIYGIIPAATWFVGDYDSDVEAAKQAGCLAARIRRPGESDEDCARSGVPVFSNLLDAVLSICG